MNCTSYHTNSRTQEILLQRQETLLNMNCSNQISKTFRLCHRLTLGSLPYCNNSELTGFNQFLIFPCIQPKSLDSFFVCQ